MLNQYLSPRRELSEYQNEVFWELVAKTYQVNNNPNNGIPIEQLAQKVAGSWNNRHFKLIGDSTMADDVGLGGTMRAEHAKTLLKKQGRTINDFHTRQPLAGPMRASWPPAANQLLPQQLNFQPHPTPWLTSQVQPFPAVKNRMRRKVRIAKGESFSALTREDLRRALVKMGLSNLKNKRKQQLEELMTAELAKKEDGYTFECEYLA